MIAVGLFFKRMGLYLKKYWKWFLGGILFLLALSGLYFVKDEVENLVIHKKKLNLLKKKQEIDVLEVKKAIVESKIDNTEEKVEEIEQEIAEAEKFIEKELKEIDNLTIEGKLDKFDDLGY